MKKLLVLTFAALMILILCACGKGENAAPPADAGGVDVDLTTLSTTMVYSKVYAMVYEPERYMGKTVKMKGQCSTGTDADGVQHYACIVQDATACCAQGLEFELGDVEDYPARGEEITVVGTFDSYVEERDGNKYIYLILREASLV